MAAVTRLTPSALEDFEGCPLHFKLVYVERAGPPGQRLSPQLSFGNSLHHCLYLFHNGGGHQRFGPEEMVKLLTRSWTPSEASPQTDEQRGAGR